MQAIRLTSQIFLVLYPGLAISNMVANRRHLPQ